MLKNTDTNDSCREASAEMMRMGQVTQVLLAVLFKWAVSKPHACTSWTTSHAETMFQTQVSSTYNQIPLSKQMQARQLRWLGHQSRLETPRVIPNTTLLSLGTISWQAMTGWKTHHRQGIYRQTILRRHPTTAAELRRAATNRREWHSRVVACGRWPILIEMSTSQENKWR